jgi:hypothetical protein
MGQLGLFLLPNGGGFELLNFDHHWPVLVSMIYVRAETLRQIAHGQFFNVSIRAFTYSDSLNNSVGILGNALINHLIRDP